MRTPGVLVLVAVALLTGCSSSDGTGVADGTTADGEASPALESALSDVESVAVALESYYRGAGYPEDVDGAVASMGPAGLSLSPGNRIATYAYDAEAVEFAMCVETEDGAFATYDTAPMSLRLTGETGGCPDA